MSNDEELPIITFNSNNNSLVRNAISIFLKKHITESYFSEEKFFHRITRCRIPLRYS
jgi:hypothetical protein